MMSADADAYTADEHVFNWARVDELAEQRATTTAIVSRMLRPAVTAIRESSLSPDEHDEGILEAYATYLTALTHGCLPRDDDEAGARDFRDTGASAAARRREGRRVMATVTTIRPDEDSQPWPDTLCAACRAEEGRPHVGITFRDDWLSGRGPFTRVLRDGRDFGFIVQTASIYRFYTDDQPKLGGADLEGVDIEHLKARIQEKYGREC
jgi:hypothetical protein